MGVRSGGEEEEVMVMRNIPMIHTAFIFAGPVHVDRHAVASGALWGAPVRSERVSHPAREVRHRTRPFEPLRGSGVRAVRRLLGALRRRRNRFLRAA